METEPVADGKSDDPIGRKAGIHRGLGVPDAPQRAGANYLNAIEDLENCGDREIEWPLSSANAASWAEYSP